MEKSKDNCSLKTDECILTVPDVLLLKTLLKTTPQDLIPQDVLPNETEDCNSSNSRILTGVIVNGFHPQLSAWKENNYKTIKRKRNDMDQIIEERVSRAKTEAEKRIKAKFDTIERSTKTTSVDHMYATMFEHSNVPQLIAAPGGRIASWNNNFFDLAQFKLKDRSMESLTIFDLVIPSMIPKLYEIFLMALYEDGTQHSSESSSDDDANVKYQTLCVPCVPLDSMEEKYYMMFSLMYDSDPSKRCFHCIISTTPKEPIGEIFPISQSVLMKMLL